MWSRTCRVVPPNVMKRCHSKFLMAQSAVCSHRLPIHISACGRGSLLARRCNLVAHDVVQRYADSSLPYRYMHRGTSAQYIRCLQCSCWVTLRYFSSWFASCDACGAQKLHWCVSGYRNWHSHTISPRQSLRRMAILAQRDECESNYHAVSAKHLTSVVQQSRNWPSVCKRVIRVAD